MYNNLSISNSVVFGIEGDIFPCYGLCVHLRAILNTGIRDAMTTKLSLGQRIMLSRDDLGITQDELARSSGVSRSYINSIENGRVTNVGLDAITKIAESLGVSLAYLMGASNSPVPESPDLVLAETSGKYLIQEVDSPGLRRLYQDVLSSFASLPPDSQIVVYNLIQHMRRVEEDHAANTSPPTVHNGNRHD